jgi:hypothetical protein
MPLIKPIGTLSHHPTVVDLDHHLVVAHPAQQVEGTVFLGRRRCARA